MHTPRGTGTKGQRVPAVFSRGNIANQSLVRATLDTESVGRNSRQRCHHPRQQVRRSVMKYRYTCINIRLTSSMCVYIYIYILLRAGRSIAQLVKCRAWKNVLGCNYILNLKYSKIPDIEVLRVQSLSTS